MIVGGGCSLFPVVEAEGEDDLGHLGTALGSEVVEDVDGMANTVTRVGFHLDPLRGDSWKPGNVGVAQDDDGSVGLYPPVGLVVSPEVTSEAACVGCRRFCCCCCRWCWKGGCGGGGGGGGVVERGGSSGSGVVDWPMRLVDVSLRDGGETTVALRLLGDRRHLCRGMTGWSGLHFGRGVGLRLLPSLADVHVVFHHLILDHTGRGMVEGEVRPFSPSDSLPVLHWFRFGWVRGARETPSVPWASRVQSPWSGHDLGRGWTGSCSASGALHVQPGFGFGRVSGIPGMVVSACWSSRFSFLIVVWSEGLCPSCHTSGSVPVVL